MTKIFSKFSILETVFYFFCMFPFLFPIHLIAATDLQPYALFVSVVILMIYFHRTVHTKLPYAVIYFGLVFFVALIVFCVSDFTTFALRSVANYASLFFIPLATFLIIKKAEGENHALIKRFILVWFLVGLVQIFFDRGFLSPIISGARWSASYRGVIGLAFEPSFYGIICYFCLYLVKRFEKQKIFFMVWSY